MGAGLPAKAVYQYQIGKLTHRFRRQASSHTRLSTTLGLAVNQAAIDQRRLPRHVIRIWPGQE